ncbi:MAG TPA: Maf family protein [Gemmatimonadaceae bacterium]|nr:Maf family protein [Gemmatimonadaceae bacterium]
MDELRFVLASASPRRRELLGLIGIQHTVDPADIDESMHVAELPAAHVERLAREKVSKVAARHPGALVIAADTVVVLDGRVMGKPRTEDQAYGMLSDLSGATHTVLTGMACTFNGELESSVDDVSVTFRSLSKDEIREYIATGEPMDKAGSYGIQGYGATIVQRIDGDYFAVMGLSLVRLVELMQKLRVSYHFGGATRHT